MTANNPRGHPRQAGRITDSTTRTASGSGAADRDTSILVPAAFYRRTAQAAGTDDSAADRYRQLTLCRSAAVACGARMTAEFFDEDCRADDPLQHRPGRRSVLAGLSGSRRAAGAVVIADPWRLPPRHPAPQGTGILALLSFRCVQLMLANSGMVTSTAAEAALLGTLLTGPARSAPSRGTPSGSSIRDYQAHGSLPGQHAVRLRWAAGEPR